MLEFNVLSYTHLFGILLMLHPTAEAAPGPPGTCNPTPDLNSFNSLTNWDLENVQNLREALCAPDSCQEPNFSNECSLFVRPSPDYQIILTYSGATWPINQGSCNLSTVRTAQHLV